MSATRKLAAILAADVVGYGRLTGVDEEGTLDHLKTLRRELIDPTIAAHRGRIVKTMGDGLLIEFASVVDAVRCAVEVQRGMPARNSGIAGDKRIEFRIGINLGDVVAEGNDLLGDGVNVAARLEGLAEPGGICISGTAFDQVLDKLPVTFTDQGEQTVKNIARPVRVYALNAEAVASLPEQPSLPTRSQSPRRGSIGRWVAQAAAVFMVVLLLVIGVGFLFRRDAHIAPFATAPRLSIVVLPFANLSGDPAQDYLADVITDELTTSLSRIGGAFVIARSTAFTYKGKAVDAKQVGRDLGVRYVLEGSEQNSGNRVRVNAQLIDAETGTHVWAEQFDADRADLLNMQDEIVTRLARALDVQMVAIEAAHVARTRPGNLDAEDLAMRCQAGWNSSTWGSAEYDTAYGLCEHALQIDDRNVLALSVLAIKYAIRLTSGLSSDPQTDIRQADELISRALASSPITIGPTWLSPGF
jgi:adenylate cyclase